MKIVAFFRQPTTVAGLATVCGTLEAVLTGHLTWSASVPLFVGAAVSILLPDNSAAKADAEAATRAVLALADTVPKPSPSQPETK